MTNKQIHESLESVLEKFIMRTTSLPQFYKEFKTLRNLIKLLGVVKIAKRVDGRVIARYLLWKKTRGKEH
jgi:hypothetical protein